VRISSPGWEGRWKSSVIDPVCVGQLGGECNGEMIVSGSGDSLAFMVDCIKAEQRNWEMERAARGGRRLISC